MYTQIEPVSFMRTKFLPMLRSVSVQVYVPWNVHEPYPEQYNWEGMADLEAYLQLAQDMGLYVLLRPGPYICAEWDFGGFPWWLASSKVSQPSNVRRFDWALLLSRRAPSLQQGASSEDLYKCPDEPEKAMLPAGDGAEGPEAALR